jgi:hypothetical protein
MVTVIINENTTAGERILNEIANNPHIGHVSISEPVRNMNGDISGYISVDEYFSKLKAAVRNKYQEVSRENL